MTAVEASAAPIASSERHLRGRLAVVVERVRAEVTRRRVDDPEPDDRFRGLYVSDDHVDTLLAAAPSTPAPDPDRLAAVEAEADEAEAAGADLRLRRLARTFGLDGLDVELLLLASAPDLDARFERLYGYLNDDVSRRRATVGLVGDLLSGAGVGSGAVRSRLAPSAALVAEGLLLVEEPSSPLLGRPLRVPDRVLAHLLGDDRPAPTVAALLADPGHGDPEEARPLADALASGARLVGLREQVGSAGAAHAAAALELLGSRALAVDLERLETGADVPAVAAALALEARLTGAGLIAGPLESLVERGMDAVRALAEAPGTVLLVGARSWDPAWSRRVPHLTDAPLPALGQRAATWRAALADGGLALADSSELERVVQPFRLTPAQVARAVTAAGQDAAAAGRPVEGPDLVRGARAQNAAGLERLARRIAPTAGWQDLVLPTMVRAQLGELAARARHRDQVLDEWGLGSASRGRGVTGLFAGESGTGKTLAAEVVAGDLGLDLYVVDLATVVDKYIGETEKHLDRIFSEADRVNGVLLFDEADALFGKRSEVSDARDRYANVEVAYLLQRMEAFDGVALLTTNLRANLDEAFTRRLDAIVDFPVPEPAQRVLLWRLHLGAGSGGGSGGGSGLPLTGDVDVEFLAESFALSGGEIRNIAVTAAYLAAAGGSAVGMREVVRATEREYRKLGRLTVSAEFGRWYEVLER